MIEKRHMLERGAKAAKYSSLTSASLALVKGIIGLLSGSVALTADAVNNLTDIVSAFSVYVGLKLSQKEATEAFPYGYYKAETLAMLVVSAVIIFAGVEILITSAKHFINPVPITMTLPGLIIAVFSAAVLLFLSKYKVRVGIEIGSHALVSEGRNSLMDVLSSIVVFLGIFFSYLGYRYIEAVAGFFIGVMIIVVGAGFGKNAILVLMDASLEPELVEKFRSLALEVNDVKGVHSMRVRRSGPFVFAEMHLEADEDLSVKDSHQISDEVEMKIKSEMAELDSLTVHIEPREENKVKIAIPVEDDHGMDSVPSLHLGGAPYFLIAETEQGEIMDFAVYENPAKALGRKKRGIKAAEFLMSKKIDILLFEQIAKGPEHFFSDMLVEIQKPKGKDLREIILSAVMKEDPELAEKVRSLTLEVEGVKGVHSIRIRHSGPHIFAEMHLETDEDLSVKESHQISEAVETKVKAEITELNGLVVHVEPLRNEVVNNSLLTEDEYLEKIRSLALEVNGVKGIHSVQIRRSGAHIFAEMHLEADEDLSVKESHRITEEVEAKVKREITELDSLTVHIEPI